MLKRLIVAAALLAPVIGVALPAAAEKPIWGIQVEQLEYRITDGTDIFAWDFDALYGTDELKIVWRSEAEYAVQEDGFETLENQIRLQTPISDFFDAVVGFRADTPKGSDRFSGVIGIHGLSQQWFEIDADLFISDKPSARFEVEYEGLITNRITLVPSIEIEVPFTDDNARNIGAFGPKLEVGARLSYDLIDRAISPYIGVHYEQVFGETAERVRAAGEDAGTLFGVVGVRILF
jgi:copper resistance protein B